MLKTAWHWGSDWIVVNDPLGEPDHTPLHVGLPSACGSVDSERLFSPISWGGVLNWGLWQKWMNKAQALKTEHLSLHRDPAGATQRGTPLTGTLRERWVIRGCVEEGSENGCLSLTGNFERWLKEVLQQWSIPLCRSSVMGTWRGKLLCWQSERTCGGVLWRQASPSMGAPPGSLEGSSFTFVLKKALEMGISLHRGPTGNLGGSVYLELWGGSRNRASLYGSSVRGTWRGGLLYWGPWRICKRRLWRRASLFIGAQSGNLEWAYLPGTLRDGWRRALEMEHISLSLCGSSVRGTKRGGPLLWTLKVM